MGIHRRARKKIRLMSVILYSLRYFLFVSKFIDVSRHNVHNSHGHDHAKKRSSATQHAELTRFAVRNVHSLRTPHTVGVFNQDRRSRQVASFGTVSTQARTPMKYWCTSWDLYSGTLAIGSRGNHCANSCFCWQGRVT